MRRRKISTDELYSVFLQAADNGQVKQILSGRTSHQSGNITGKRPFVPIVTIANCIALDWLGRVSTDQVELVKGNFTEERLPS
jgi:hypothetical protein